MSNRVLDTLSINGKNFNPGDKVVVVSRSTGYTNIRRGEYVGFVERPIWQYNGWRQPRTQNGSSKHVQVKVPSTKQELYDLATGNVVKWDGARYNNGELKFRTVPCERIITLNRNKILPHDCDVDALIETV